VILGAVLIFGGTASALFLCGELILPGSEGGRAVDRVIKLSMRDFTFNGNNPELQLNPGELVRFVVTNDEPDPLVLHSFIVPGLNVRCETPIKPGETREFVVRVPARGDLVYNCCTHPGMGGAMKIVQKK